MNETQDTTVDPLMALSKHAKSELAPALLTDHTSRLFDHALHNNRHSVNEVIADLAVKVELADRVVNAMLAIERDQNPTADEVSHMREHGVDLVKPFELRRDLDTALAAYLAARSTPTRTVKGE